MTWWERWGFNTCHAIIATTGLVYFYMKYAMTTDDPFALVNHPWQPHMLSIHVVAAPLGVAFFGMLFRSHTVRKLVSANRANRRSGWIVLVSFAVMAMTGYLLQVVTSPLSLTVMTWGHIGGSLVFIVVYVCHLVVSWRMTRRSPSGVRVLLPDPAPPSV